MSKTNKFIHIKRPLIDMLTIFVSSTSKESCEVTLAKALKVLDSNYLNLEDVTFKSALRPLSGDDLPIVGNNILLH